MIDTYIEDKHFTASDIPKEGLKPGEYENCSFSGCNFNSAGFSGFSFLECEFLSCDLSNAKLRGTTLSEVVFKECKLLGLGFNECNPFLLSLQFRKCIVNFSSFFALKLKGIRFSSCRLEQVDFSEADLREANFLNSDLSGAIFSNTNLEYASFESASGFSIDPSINRIKKAKFSKENISGLLDKYQIIIT